MRNFLNIIAFLILFALPTQAQTQAPKYVEGEGLRIPVYSYAGLAPLLTASEDTIHVINFWATWCAPCVKELPYFEELHRAALPVPVKVTLVSLDFRKQLVTRLLPFLRERDITASVVVLDDPDANAWINKVDATWSGAIPATLVLRGAKREFREQSFTRDELFQFVHTFME
ncbi:MAG TPA: TlpA family protein disulfide reductase [Bacteroidota bacterium]|nr:TlpA family protein disulfide reductase [Bacteroidota bacterium]